MNFQVSIAIEIIKPIFQDKLLKKEIKSAVMERFTLKLMCDQNYRLDAKKILEYSGYNIDHLWFRANCDEDLEAIELLILLKNDQEELYGILSAITIYISNNKWKHKLFYKFLNKIEDQNQLSDLLIKISRYIKPNEDLYLAFKENLNRINPESEELGSLSVGTIIHSISR